MRSNYRKLGDYIRDVNIRNADLSITKLLGVSMEKTFISSVANIIGTDMSLYKVLKKGQLACKLMSVGRDEKLPVDLYNENEDAIVSSAYYVFEPIDSSIILPEYLFMWLCRPENDRYIGYISGGDVRGGISWETFCETPIKVPSVSKQKEIVKEYNVILNLITINQRQIQKLEETIQTIYKQWFVDFEFPYDFALGKPVINGIPFKSNGGEMTWNEELEKEIPKEWKYEDLGKITIIKAGGDKPKIFSVVKTNKCKIPIFSNSSFNEGLFGYTNDATVLKDSITISARGAIIGYTELRTEPFVPIVRLIVVIPKHEYQLNYIFHCIKNFKYDDSGSAQGQLTVPEISSFKVITPDSEVLSKYQIITSKFTRYLNIKKNENKKLEELKELLLSKLATIN
jgi:type I restriction enzyme S subunit